MKRGGGGGAFLSQTIIKIEHKKVKLLEKSVQKWDLNSPYPFTIRHGTVNIVLYIPNVSPVLSISLIKLIFIFSLYLLSHFCRADTFWKPFLTFP